MPSPDGPQFTDPAERAFARRNQPTYDAAEAMAHACPRCGGGIPNDEQRGLYPGAVSRTTRDPAVEDVEVCSNCGTQEALEEFAGVLVPQRQWPVPPDTGLDEDDVLENMPPSTPDQSDMEGRRFRPNYDATDPFGPAEGTAEELSTYLAGVEQRQEKRKTERE